MTSEAVGYGMAPCVTCEACARRDAQADHWCWRASNAEADVSRLRAQLAAVRAAWRPGEYAGFRAVSGESGVVYAITAEQRAAIDAALEGGAE